MSDPTEFRDWIPDGYQVVKARRPRKRIPPWANSDAALKLRILGPGLRVWRVADLYWRQDLTARETAEELGITEGAVEQIIMRLRRTERRKRATIG